MIRNPPAPCFSCNASTGSVQQARAFRKEQQLIWNNGMQAERAQRQLCACRSSCEVSHHRNNQGSALTGKCQHAPAGEFAHPSCSSIPTPALGESPPIIIKAVVIVPMAKPLLVYRIYIFIFCIYLENCQDPPSYDQQTFRNTHTYLMLEIFETTD